MYVPDKLMFGTAGIPLSTPERNIVNGISQVRALGLDVMELEFVRSVNVSEAKAPEVKAIAKDKKVLLTCHAPYYINLGSDDTNKVDASKKRIEKSAEILSLCGGWSVCFHPGVYMGNEKKDVFKKIEENIKDIRNKLDNSGADVWLRPETTGKKSQFGHHKELLELSSGLEGVMPVFDFSHIHAREGRYNTEDEFREIFEDIEKYLGKEGLHNMHIHLSGINYGDKGEKNHLVLRDSDMEYKKLVFAWKEFKLKGVVISESPNIEKDALLLQKIYNQETYKI